MNDIKTNIRNNMLSSGNVKITLLRDGKEIGQVTSHNTGTVDLCEYMIRALIGDYVIAERPDIIVPFYTSGGDNIVDIGNGSPSIGSKIVVPASYWENNENQDGGFCAATLTFLIPSSIISGSTIEGFKLLSKDNSRKVYATVKLPDDSSISVSGDTNLKVEWTLYVSYRWDIDKRGV